MRSIVQTVEHSFRVMTSDIDFAGVVSNLSYIRWLDGWSHLRNLCAERSLSLGAAFQRGIAPALMRTENAFDGDKKPDRQNLAGYDE